MNLVDRAKNLILQPKQEWAVIDGESHTVQDLFTRYVLILAAIPPACSFVGLSIVGIGALDSPYRIPLGSGVAHFIIGYVMSLAAVYVLALVIDGYATTFGCQKNFMQALKVAAFFPTPGWLAGVFNIIPALWIIGFLLSLYSLYLLFVGLPMLMKAPEDKAIAYLVVVVIAAIVIFVVIGALVGLTIPAPVRGY